MPQGIGPRRWPKAMVQRVGPRFWLKVVAEGFGPTRWPKALGRGVGPRFRILLYSRIVSEYNKITTVSYDNVIFHYRPQPAQRSTENNVTLQ